MNCKQANTADTLYHTAHQLMCAVLDRTLIDHHRETTAWGYWEIFQYVSFILFPEQLPRRGRLDKALLELGKHIFQNMGITTCKGDLQAYKLELTSLGANQKKGHIYIGTERRDKPKKKKEGRLGLGNFKNGCLYLTLTAES